MALSPRQTWRLCVGLALVAAAVAPHVRAQEAGWETYYSRQNAFLIPFRFDANDRRIQSVLLQVSEDLGRTYQQNASAAPTERGFRFQARHDGWYWFAVQTRDTEGRLYPTSVAQVQQGIKVCVDTKPPAVTLRPAQPREGTVAVEWDISDDNLDLDTLRVEYRPSGARDWALLRVARSARDQQSWSPPAGGPVEVRLQVMDKARNPAEATTTVTPGAYRPGPGAGTAAGPADAPRGQVIHVRSLAFQLNYECDNVGPSLVKNVEIWWTDKGKLRWQKYASDAKEKGPYPVRVERPGRYGFTLIARSGVGLAARAPEPGDEPQLWVEVDTEKPLVTVHNAVVSAETGKLTVAWSANDRFFRAQPITISYAKAREGPWATLPGAERLDNTGTFSCATDPPLPYQLYVRVTATDEAGNVGSDVFRDPVKIDLKVPQVRSINVIASDPGPPPPP
jgi:hypothetical protein